MSIQFASRNSAIGIILALNLLFFTVWVVTLFMAVEHPALSDVTTKLYGVFMGVNNALMLVLNSEAKAPDPPSIPTQPVEPAQPK